MIAGIDFGILGYVIVGIFLVAWSVSTAVWKFGRIEERYGHAHPLHTHEHAHDGGLSHSHKHFH
jgi:high-affinity nickel-transport protein